MEYKAVQFIDFKYPWSKEQHTGKIVEINTIKDSINSEYIGKEACLVSIDESERPIPLLTEHIINIRSTLEELKPCPFCNSDKVKFEQTEKGACYIHCLNCGAKGSVAPRDEKDWAIKSWNKRGDSKWY